MSEQNENNAPDASLWIRRIILTVISTVVGFLMTYAAVVFVLGTTMSDYGVTYIFFTTLTAGLGVAIWLDHERVLNTKILPH